MVPFEISLERSTFPSATKIIVSQAIDLSPLRKLTSASLNIDRIAFSPPVVLVSIIQFGSKLQPLKTKTAAAISRQRTPRQQLAEAYPIFVATGSHQFITVSLRHQRSCPYDGSYGNSRKV